MLLGRSHNKGNKFERKIGKFMLKHDGDCPKWGDLTTKNARAGQLSELKMDILTRTYATEAKHRAKFPKWIFESMKSIKNNPEGKHPLLVIRGDFIIHVILPERHIDLMKKEKIYLGELELKDKNFESKGYAVKKIDKKKSPKWLFGDMKKIINVAKKHSKEALFIIKKDARTYPVLHLITSKRHSDLLLAEKSLVESR